MESIATIVRQLAEENLKGEEYFIADVSVSSGNGPSKIAILLDSDEGVNIDDCAELSRAVGHILEERDIIGGKYTLEVSSPGVDFPLSSLRQYKKNIGRGVKITLSDGKDVKGKLKDATDAKLVVDKEKKKGKLTTYEEIEIPMSEVKKTIVQVSFK